MSVLKVRPTRITWTQDGRRVYPCGCVDVPDIYRLTRPAVRPFVFCNSHDCQRHLVKP